MTSPTKRQANRGAARPIAAIAVLAILAAFGLEWLREALGREVITLSFDALHGSAVAMSVAGWLMVVAGPIAAVYYGHDFRKAIAAARTPRPDGMARFAGRRRARRGHGTERPWTYWVKRALLLIPIALAVTFVLPIGLVGEAPPNWATLPGGTDFLRGVKWSLVATFAAGVIVIGSELLMLTEPKRWVSRTVAGLALLAPLGALAILLT